MDVRTQAQRAEAFKLRHKAFVEENKWYTSGNGMEIDHYDFQSEQGLVYHQPTSLPVGTSRLILTDPHDLGAPLPAERFLPEGLRVDRRRVGEVSRITVAPEFRAPDPRAPLMHPVLGLIAWHLRTAARLGLTHWYAVMEPCLARGLRTFGMHLPPLTRLVEYHGACRVYGQSYADFISGIYARRPEVARLLTNDGAVRF